MYVRKRFSSGRAVLTTFLTNPSLSVRIHFFSPSTVPVSSVHIFASQVCASKASTAERHSAAAEERQTRCITLDSHKIQAETRWSCVSVSANRRPPWDLFYLHFPIAPASVYDAISDTPFLYVSVILFSFAWRRITLAALACATVGEVKWRETRRFHT